MIRKFKWILLLCFIVIPIKAQQDAGATGRVIDSRTGKGIPGVHLWIDENESCLIENPSKFATVAGMDGNFSITGMDSGFYFIHCTALGYAQLSQEFFIAKSQIITMELKMVATLIPLGEVSVTALRSELKIRDVPVPMAVVSSNNINQQNWNTMSDILSSQAGVSLARDGVWATSVNIRGLSEQRLVTLIDGNRVETATDIAGALSMINPDDIEQIEIIKGAASSVYGTGALGGVINVHTREGKYSLKPYMHGRISTGWNTVNTMGQGTVSMNAGGSKWYMKLSSSYRQAGNLQTDSGKIENSQFKDRNIAGVLAYKPSQNKELKLNWQMFHGWNIGIPGGIGFPKTATASYTRADRNMFSATYTAWNLLPSLTKIQTKFFMQNIRRDVILKPSSAVLISPVGKHYTNGLQVNSDWQFGYNHHVIIGLDAWERSLNTSREKEIKTPLKDSIRGEIPIPASTFTSVGIYIQDEWILVPERLKLLLGTRGDNIHVLNDKAVDPLYTVVNGVQNNIPAGQRITFDSSNVADFSWSANTGLLYTTGANIDFSLSMARGYRSPSLEERFKYIDLGSFVRLGNPELKPEQGWFFDLGARSWNQRFNLVVDGFLNAMTNLIVEDSSSFVYSYSQVPGKQDTLFAFKNENVEKAVLMGADLSINWNCFDNVVLSGNLTYVYGKNTTTNAPLPAMPPLNGSLTLKYSMPGWGSAYVNSRFADRQNRIASGEKATDGYIIFDAGIHTSTMGWKKVKMEISTGVDNIFNKYYSLHLNTYRSNNKGEAGLNFFLRMNLLF